jgi:hypothetical protein
MPAVATAPQETWEAEHRRYPGTYQEATSSMSSQPDTNHYFLRELLKTAQRSEYQLLEQQYAALQGELLALNRLSSGWDSYRAPIPNEQSINKCKNALGIFRKLLLKPTAVRASAEGGVGICFVSATGYAHIEFLNSGEVFGLSYSQVAEPETWPVELNETSLAQFGDRISAHV